MAVGCVNQANAAADENMMLFPYQFNCLRWKIAMFLCWVLQCWMWQVPLSLDTERVTAMVLQAVSFDQWKRCDPLEILCYNVERKLCIAVVTAIVMTLRSLMKTEPRTAKLRQVDSHCQGLTGKWTSEWMNLSFVFCSLPLCHFLILSFQVVCFWEKILQHDFACCLSMLPLKFQGTWMFLPVIPFSRNRHLRKTQTEFQYFVHLLEVFCISLPINAKKNLLQHLFFAKHTYLVELHLELSSGSSLHLYRSLSLFHTRCAPFRVWKCSQALLPPYRIAAHHFLPFRVPANK